MRSLPEPLMWGKRKKRYRSKNGRKDDMIELRNKNVLIFGGGSGIGKAVAQRFLEGGAEVMITGRTEAKLKETAEEIGSEHLHYAVCDVADISSHSEIFKIAEEQMGGLNAFLNAAAPNKAAICGAERAWEPFDITEEEWDILTDINFKAAYFLMRNEIVYLKERNIRGNILNVASNAAYMGICGHYGASKLSIVRWTRYFGNQYGHDGIIINGIAPGATLTPMIFHYAKSVDQPYPRHAIERLIRPDEIAELAFYLMSNYGEIICGHTVVADGGDNMATL